MYSPYDAVYGHDTTYIQRMTVEEYTQELQEEEADLCGLSSSPQTFSPTLPLEKKGDRVTTSPRSATQLQPKRGTRQYEQRRVALSSRNPNVIFSSKYPMYDRLGRELCVAYQIQDMAVQQELRRLEFEQGQGERNSRRSGVRLSAELPMGSDGTTVRPGSLTETQPPSSAEGRETALSEEASRLVRPSHMDCDDFVDIEVSATSHYPSVFASRTSSRPASVRPSEFSIFRESGAVASRGGFGKAHSSIPVRTVAEEDKILIHRGAGGGPLRATSVPSSSSAFARNGRDESEGRRSAWRRRSDKRRRSRSSGDRLSRVRFISEERDENAADAVAHAHVKPALEQQQQQQTMATRAPGAAVPPPRRLQTPPPVPLSDADQTRVEGAAPEEATRWTTLSRGSAAVRATKQLFRNTAQSINAPRMTATLAYPQPIPSSAYGLSAPVIPASKVHDAVEHNVAVCSAAMPQQYTSGFGSEVSSERPRSTPELHCGSVVRLGKEWYRLVRFHVVAEVYEAVRVEAPVATASSAAPKQDRDADHGDDRHEVAKEADARADEKDVAAATHAAPSMKRKEDEGQREASTTALASHTPHGEQPPTHLAAEAAPSSFSFQEDPSASGQGPAQQQQQCFVYRWRAAILSRRVDEARRAALGLSLFAPQVHITSFDYEDGGGITLVTLPAGNHAVPVSALPLSLRSYTTLLRTFLKALSAMMARRTVHGNVASLGDLFLVLPVDDPQHSSECTQLLRQDGGGGLVEDKSHEPFVVMFHWEHWVDFGMYIDRNAGRTLPLDFEDSTVQSLVYYSKDLLTGLQLFLEHALAAELTSEQYILLQKLVVLAAEPTPVASHLIQLKNLMLTLPTDTAALQRSFEAALVRYTVE
ncbi:hypothetical protein ABL78_2341 [Leptomonas seymouri]|uniref:Uncharacterized protein n=1 Tax=Leptomonas seymouri TaxID=5684 RepID=A0A0N0P794_LEPSE|nr:hypothetical protein ABL78_2341 [Leptomonas seymouri]|eukprot:KPI88529.1 hypothetical protein ABL78_2341 [Leptomonas seymouri]